MRIHQTNEDFLLLGSNLDADAHMGRAMEELDRRFEVVAASSLIESEPVGMPKGTPDFLNRVVMIRTKLSTEQLYDELKGIENCVGRTPSQRGFRSRVIDIDILLYGDRIVKTERLEIPHPDIERYDFVARLLAEIAPDLRHPLTGRTMREIAASLRAEDRSAVRRPRGSND